MKPEIIYRKNYCECDKQNNYFAMLRESVNWENREAPRAEYFMGFKAGIPYTYGEGPGERTYYSNEMIPLVNAIMQKLNLDFNSQYNICFLNYYASEKQHLGWHSDDSPSQDTTHGIAVVSFGADRWIYFKEKEYKGEIPEDNKYMLGNNTLFVMPPHMQETHLHKIPKGDKPCGGRISLTFRKYIG